MKTTFRFRRVVKLLAAICGVTVTTWTFSAAAEEQTSTDHADHAEHAAHGKSHGSMMEQLKGLSGQQFDAEFLQMMTQHHEDAVKMAKMAQSKSSNAELKKLAQQSEQKQSEQIDQMTQLLESQYHQKLKPMSMDDPQMMQTMRQMNDLESLSGAQFDQRFVNTMIGHHQQGVAMAKLALQRTQNDDVSKLAQQIVDDQTKEVAELRRINSSVGQ